LTYHNNTKVIKKYRLYEYIKILKIHLCLRYIVKKNIIRHIFVEIYDTIFELKTDALIWLYCMFYCDTAVTLSYRKLIFIRNIGL